MLRGEKKDSFRNTFKKYLSNNIILERWQKIGIMFLIVVIGGFFGWVYEFIFYFFDGGMKEWYMQGGNLLPWINIYAIGALLIIATTYKVRRHPWSVFLISVVATGVLEFLAGWLVYVIGGGTRYWDYNTEILNFGNIEGFVCLRSVLFFGLSALMLIYIILPFCIFLAQRLNKRTFLTIATILFALVLLDELTNLILKIANLPTAMDFYQALKLKYK